MERKWEWIARRLEELGLKRLARKAWKIDRVLCRLYERKYTEAWMEEYDGVQRRWRYAKTVAGRLYVLWLVMTKSAYCVACEESRLCRQCKFRRVAGMCLCRGSWFKDVAEIVEVMCRVYEMLWSYERLSWNEITELMDHHRRSVIDEALRLLKRLGCVRCVDGRWEVIGCPSS